ncbi:MAG: hypothetical protein ACYSVY_17865, partial [Planctomycetota bacterium]
MSDHDEDPAARSQRRPHDVAWDIHKVVDSFGGMERFRSWVQQWATYHEHQKRLAKNWELGRRVHFKYRVPADAQLRDSEAGPPEPGWEWEGYNWNKREPTDGDLEDEVVSVQGWTPPDLL